MNKKFFILIPFILLILIFYYATSKNSSKTIVINEFYEENSEINEIISREIIVHITGAVQNPGIVTIPEGSRIIDVISSAGGATSDADFSKINLAYIISDAQKIYIPSINDISNEVDYITTSPGENIVEFENNSNTVNINTASQSELETLPGVGPSTALKIIDYRKNNGNFQKIDDIMNVPGIGEAKFNSLKDFIRIK